MFENARVSCRARMSNLNSRLALSGWLRRRLGAVAEPRGQKLVESLRGRGEFKMSTNEIVALMRGPSADEG